MSRGIPRVLQYASMSWCSVKAQGQIYLHLFHLQNSFAAQSASYPLRTGSSYSMVNREMRAADHSPPSSDEVTNAWKYTSTSQYVFMVWCLFKHIVRGYLGDQNTDGMVRYKCVSGESIVRLCIRFHWLWVGSCGEFHEPSSSITVRKFLNSYILDGNSQRLPGVAVNS
jgi:hypothetical protein